MEASIRLIAETAWHHQGNFEFQKQLISKLADESRADIIKLHLTLDIDEYMTREHDAYELLKSWMFTREQWRECIENIRSSPKDLMLLLMIPKLWITECGIALQW